MADRQDIDALLVGALYGELSAAEDAQLQAHLVSHPHERVALDAMERTRTRVREVVAEAGPLEPSPGISALLLQEAARRAPSRKAAPVASGGAWAWLTGVMRPMMLHPAMTAAAAFVLVAGVAGTLYTTGHVAVREAVVAREAAAPPSTPTPATGADPYQVQLDEQRPLVPGAMPWASAPAGEAADRDDRAVAGNLGQRAGTARNSEAKADGARPGEQQAQPQDDLTSYARGRSVAGAGKANDKVNPKRKAAKDGPFIQVTTPEPELKLYEEERAPAKPAAREHATSKQEAASGVAAARPMAPQPVSVDSAAPAPASVQAPATESVSLGGAATRDAKLEEWAGLQHKKLTALVRANRCAEAATVAGNLAARASEYYAAHVADDRALRACKPALDRARKQEAERRGKPRAASPADNAAAATRE